MQNLYILTLTLFATVAATPYTFAAAERLQTSLNEQLLAAALVKKLLAQGASVVYQDRDGNTALHYAIESRWYGGLYRDDLCIQPAKPLLCHQMVKALVLAGANPQQPNHEGKTVLGIAQAECHSFDRAYAQNYRIILEAIQEAIITRNSACREHLQPLLPAPLVELIAEYEN